MVAGLRAKSSAAPTMNKSLVCFGELLIRLSSPGRELIMQSGALHAHIGGAEANVAVGLACLGHHTSIVSAVPDNALGRSAIAAVRAHGVDCRGVAIQPGRMGLYFLAHGAGQRSAEIIYDRVDSSFARARKGDFDWDALLANASRLHLSGVTPALSALSAEMAIDAATAAQRLGVPVSFDGNFRAQLWQRWDSHPAQILRELISRADILFGNHRDISLVLGHRFSGDGEARRREAALAAFDAFPSLRLIASTARSSEDADCNQLSARIDTRGDSAQTKEMRVSGIVDRIGAGDAFAAGVLHEYARSIDILAMAETGLALTCLKHSLPGDASLFRQADLDAFASGNLDVRR